VPRDLSDEQLPTLLDQFDARQVLHVTFGSLLEQYRDPFYAALSAHEDTYQAVLKQHFARHIAPFSASA